MSRAEAEESVLDTRYRLQVFLLQQLTNRRRSTHATAEAADRLGLVVLLAFGFLVALLLAALWAWLASRRQFAAERERLRASGEPATVEEIEAFYEVPPDDQLARLDAELRTIDYQPSFRRALSGERVVGLP